MAFFSSKAINYFCNLKLLGNIPNGIQIINPYKSAGVKKVAEDFYNKFYKDNNQRIFIFGINPGRFGGGLTGISFTDPVAMRETCGIDNSFGNRKELSSKFIYTVVEEFGGPMQFFSKVFLTALYPFAIIKGGKNYNYYDDKVLADKLKPAIIKAIQEQVNFGARQDFAIILGKKNADYFNKLNKEYVFFEKVFVLEHPRYIMQYKLKQLKYFTDKYIRLIS
jgi:hypothetical protein